MSDWIKAAGIRALKTTAQTAGAVMVSLAGKGAIVEGYPLITDIDSVVALSAALFGGILSLLTSIGGLPELDAGEIKNAKHAK